MTTTKVKQKTVQEIMAEMESVPVKSRQDFLLAQLALVQPLALLEDLLNPEVRNAALFNAVTALLKHHQISFDPVAAAQPDHPVGALKFGLPPVDYEGMVQ